MRALKTILGAFIYHSGLFQFIKYINGRARRVPVLMYHSIIGEGKKPLPSCLELLGMSVRKEFFEEHLRFLKKSYDVIPLHEYLYHRIKGSRLPGAPLVITFDDGFRDSYDNAALALERYGLTASFYVIGNSLNDRHVWIHRLYDTIDRLGPGRISIDVEGATIEDELNASTKLGIIKKLRRLTDRLDDGERDMVIRGLLGQAASPAQDYKENYMTADELRRLKAGGFTIGAHSMSHTSLNGLSYETQKEEVDGSLDAIRPYIDEKKPLEFAYPFGLRSSYDGDTKKIIRDAGFSCALSTVDGVNTDSTDLYELRRIEVGDFNRYELIMHTIGIIGLFKDIARAAVRRGD